MDEPTGGEIRRGDSYCVGADRVDRSTLELAEELGRRFKVDEGIGIVELSFHGGRFEHAWLKRRVQKAELADADLKPAATPSAPSRPPWRFGSATARRE